MFSNVQDFYQFVETLINRLHVAGEDKWEVEFKNAMYSDSFSGEVLGKLRLKFIQFQITNVIRQLCLENEVETALNYLDKVLGQR